jgi:hypothetical protein
LEALTNPPSVEISDAPELISLRGLNLSSSRALLAITLANVPKLSNIEALSPVTQVMGDVSLINTGLENLDALAGFVFAPNGVAIIGNAVLSDITGLDGLRSVSAIHIRDNPKLKLVPQFSQLVGLEVLTVVGNAELEELASAMPSMVANFGYSTGGQVFDVPWQRVEVSDNPALTRFALSRRIVSINNVFVHGNGSLEELDLGRLVNLDRLSITENSSLSTVVVRRIETIDELEVTGNPLLSLAPFAAVQTFVTDASDNAPEAAP